ncbi:hypothetical protein DERP_008106 [Dermatophagoides pteronyssinus]|uniref:Uncharacterized protein n=1 Tax=Dermatophagoides pteronyssinus TaxID=6956 RepID=A0ABQ8JJS8_DERPT|nr:hypothetical protein DERP_008106 [Dermatophagoides pteronyssinus]
MALECLLTIRPRKHYPTILPHECQSILYHHPDYLTSLIRSEGFFLRHHLVVKVALELIITSIIRTNYIVMFKHISIEINHPIES